MFLVHNMLFKLKWLLLGLCNFDSSLFQGFVPPRQVKPKPDHQEVAAEHQPVSDNMPSLLTSKSEPQSNRLFHLYSGPGLSLAGCSPEGSRSIPEQINQLKCSGITSPWSVVGHKPAQFVVPHGINSEGCSPKIHKRVVSGTAEQCMSPIWQHESVTKQPEQDQAFSYEGNTIVVDIRQTDDLIPQKSCNTESKMSTSKKWQNFLSSTTNLDDADEIADDLKQEEIENLELGTVDQIKPVVIEPAQTYPKSSFVNPFLGKRSANQIIALIGDRTSCSDTSTHGKTNTTNDLINEKTNTTNDLINEKTNTRNDLDNEKRSTSDSETSVKTSSLDANSSMEADNGDVPIIGRSTDLPSSKVSAMDLFTEEHAVVEVKRDSRSLNTGGLEKNAPKDNMRSILSTCCCSEPIDLKQVSDRFDESQELNYLNHENTSTIQSVSCFDPDTPKCADTADDDNFRVSVLQTNIPKIVAVRKESTPSISSADSCDPNCTSEKLDDTCNFDVGFDINYSPLSNMLCSDSESCLPENDDGLESTGHMVNQEREKPMDSLSLIGTRNQSTASTLHQSINQEQVEKESVEPYFMKNGKQHMDINFASIQACETTEKSNVKSLSTVSKSARNITSSTVTEKQGTTEFAATLRKMSFETYVSPCRDCNGSLDHSMLNTTVSDVSDREKNVFAVMPSNMINNVFLSDSVEEGTCSEMSEVLSEQKIDVSVSTKNILSASISSPELADGDVSGCLDDLNFSSDLEIQESQISVSQSNLINGRFSSLLAQNEELNATSSCSVNTCCDVVDEMSAHTELKDREPTELPITDLVGQICDVELGTKSASSNQAGNQSLRCAEPFGLPENCTSTTPFPDTNTIESEEDSVLCAIPASSDLQQTLRSCLSRTHSASALVSADKADMTISQIHIPGVTDHKLPRHHFNKIPLLDYKSIESQETIKPVTFKWNRNEEVECPINEGTVCFRSIDLLLSVL